MPEIKIIKRLEEEYLIRLAKCIDKFEDSKEYIDIVCAVVPLTKNSDNRNSMVSNIELLTIKYANDSKRMLSELIALGKK